MQMSYRSYHKIIRSDREGVSRAAMNQPRSKYVPLRGERLFLKWTMQAGLSCRKIEETNERTPDYDLVSKFGTFPVEVKEFEPDKELIKYLDGLYSTGFGDRARTITLGKDVNAKMKKANKQLKIRSQGCLPTMLVLNDDLKVRSATDPLNIKAAFLGPDKVDVTTYRHSNPTFRERSGRGRKVYTSISAVGVLQEAFNTEVLRLIVYHNPYAKVPLLPEWICNDYTVHRRLLFEPETFAEWVEV